MLKRDAGKVLVWIATILESARIARDHGLAIEQIDRVSARARLQQGHVEIVTYVGAVPYGDEAVALQIELLAANPEENRHARQAEWDFQKCELQSQLVAIERTLDGLTASLVRRDQLNEYTRSLGGAYVCLEETKPAERFGGGQLAQIKKRCADVFFVQASLAPEADRQPATERDIAQRVDAVELLACERATVFLPPIELNGTCLAGFVGARGREARDRAEENPGQTAGIVHGSFQAV